MISLKSGGLRTAPKKFASGTLYWLAYQRLITESFDERQIKQTNDGGLRMISNNYTARMLTDIYWQRTYLSLQKCLKESLSEIKPVNAFKAGKIQDAIASQKDEMSVKLYQRIFDQRSSFDLKAFIDFVYKVVYRTWVYFSEQDLADPMMKNFLQFPGCGVLGCEYGPTYLLRANKDKRFLIYDTGRFMNMEFIFDKKKDRFRIGDDGTVEISKDRQQFEKAELPYVFAYLFSRANLFGYTLEMIDYNPLTSLGGMGMSNLLVLNCLKNLHFLLNTGADDGTIYSQGGYVEKYLFGRETGFQEALASIAGGHILTINAPEIFGGIARRLDLKAYHQSIKDISHLVLINRPAAQVPRHPINDTWCKKIELPENEKTFMNQFKCANEQVMTLLNAENGLGFNADSWMAPYRLNSIIRHSLCPQYHGNDKQKRFIDKIHNLNGAAFPLGEGGEKAAMLVALNKKSYAGFNLSFINESESKKTEGFFTGEIPYNLLDKPVEYGNGYLNLAETGRFGFARPPLIISSYK